MSQASDVNNSLTLGAIAGPSKYNTMDSCLPSTTGDQLKAACGDLYQTISSGNSDDVIHVIESSNLKHNYFDQTTLDQGLLMACDRGRKIVVQHLLLKGASINTRDPLGYTPLLLAVEKGFIEIVRILLDKGADVNASNIRGDSALTLSVRTCGYNAMVSLLLAQKSVDVNHRNKDGCTCWMKAVEALDFDTLKLLIKSGKEIDKDINSFKEQKNVTVGTTSVTERVDSHTFNVHAIISLLEREANGSKNSLRLAVFERDLNSVRHLIDYGIVNDQLYNDGRLLIEFMEDIENIPRKQCLLNETELEIIRKLIKVAPELYLTFRANRVLVVAVNIGSYELVELLCQHIANPNTQTITYQYTEAINAAAEKGCCDLLNVLIKYANSYDCVDRSRLNFTIEKALKSGNVDVVKILNKNGVTVDVESGLNVAVKHKRLNSLRFLIGKFSDVCRFVIHNNGKCLFHEAVELGDVDIINTLLAIGSHVNCFYNGKFPLMNAGTPEVMELLIGRGAKVKQARNEKKINILSYIIRRESKKDGNRELTRDQAKKAKQSSLHKNFKTMVEILVRNGASVNDTDSRGQTPLMAAAELFNGSCVLKVLLEAGAEVNKASCEGLTALHKAVISGRFKNVEILTESGADVNKKSEKGRTALHKAIHNEEILKYLLQHGADVDALDARGNTALFLAVINYSSYNENCPVVLRYLLEAGSNVNHRNTAGETALMKAAFGLKDAVIEILCEANADVKLRSRKKKHDAITILVDRLCYKKITRGYVCDSIFYLTDRGASSSCVNLQNLYYFILKGCSTTVKRLVESGLGPSDVVTKHLDVKHTDPLRSKKISPFCFAILCNEVKLARYFSDIWYLTISDVSTLAHDQNVRRHFSRKHHTESRRFLKEFSSQPISLEKLSFVAVSTSIGTAPDRELRVRELPLPFMLKDKLLFIISSACGSKL